MFNNKCEAERPRLAFLMPQGEFFGEIRKEEIVGTL